MKKILLVISFLAITFLFFSCQKEKQYKYLRPHERDKIDEISEGIFMTNQEIILKNKNTLTNVTSLKFIIKKRTDSNSKIPVDNYDMKMFIKADKEYTPAINFASAYNIDSYYLSFKIESNSHIYYLNITFRKNKIIIHSDNHILNNTSNDGIYYNSLFLELTKV